MTDMRRYNDPAANPAVPSSMGTQFRIDHYYKQALIEARREQYFMQLANVRAMPKHMGKKIVQYHYLPLLDEENINDQGIDAGGTTITKTQFYVTLPTDEIVVANGNKTTLKNAIEDNLSGTTAAVGSDDGFDTGYAVVTVTGDLVIKVANETKANAILALNIGATKHQGSGNLYGSSRDVGTISGKLPALSETGGRVNRVGYTRKTLEGTFEKFGFFDEYTQESVDFDTDAELMQHVAREMVNGAVEMTEAALQVDLLNAAGITKYAGSAQDDYEVDEKCIVEYGDLMRLSIDLDKSRTPKHTKIITGTRMVDTRTIPGSRVMYVGSELIPTLKGMEDLHENPAFISVEKYAAGTTLLTGEIGSVDLFRIVVVPEMLKWEGAGAPIGSDDTCYETNGRFDIFPMLCIGSESFTTIGFQTDGKTVKFTIYHKKPGEAIADKTDPYGETGFKSIKWYYGFMVLRPERIGLIKTAGKY